MSDNFRFDIQYEDRPAFDLAMQIAFSEHKDADYYLDDPKAGLVFFWYCDEAKKPIKLPFAMDWKQCADMAWGWLQKQPRERYEQNLDHDGSNGKGWRVYNEDWGHVAKSHYAFVAVQPCWMWYGK